MIDETTFQILFILITLGFVSLWGFNILSVGITRDKFYTATEGLLVAVPRFLLLGASLIGMSIYAVKPDWMKWSALLLPAGVRWLGFVVGLMALLVFLWVLRSLGQNFSTSLTINKEQTLVTQGPYRWVRHPMYTSFVLLWIGFLLLAANWFIGLTGILAFLWAILVRTPKEEQMMIGRFGEQYITYMQHTGRYLPLWWGKKTASRS